MTDLLRDALFELATQLKPHGIRLTVVGGYGLVLRVQEVNASGERTLGGQAPLSRSTDDIDWLLEAGTISDGAQTKQIRDALDTLGYTATTEHLLFQRTIAGPHGNLTMRLDLMAPTVDGDMADRVQISGKRIRPVGYAGLHGRLTPEAVFIEGNVMAVDVSPDRSGLQVFVPQAFPFLIMKLFALRDGPGSKNPAKADRHALDMFTIWATITEQEFVSAQQLRERYRDHPLMDEVREVTVDLFTGGDAKGLLSLGIAAANNRTTLDRDFVAQFQGDMLSLLGS